MHCYKSKADLIVKEKFEQCSKALLCQQLVKGLSTFTHIVCSAVTRVLPLRKKDNDALWLKFRN